MDRYPGRMERCPGEAMIGIQVEWTVIQVEWTDIKARLKMVSKYYGQVSR
jgi:hypothetical protein